MSCFGSPCPPETAPEWPSVPERLHSMSKHRARSPQGGSHTTLSEVLTALLAHRGLSATRLRDLRSAVVRVAELLGDPPDRIPVDLPAISARLATVHAVGKGISQKRLANIRSDFLAAMKASGLVKVPPKPRPGLHPAWAAL